MTCPFSNSGLAGATFPSTTKNLILFRHGDAEIPLMVGTILYPPAILTTSARGINHPKVFRRCEWTILSHATWLTTTYVGMRAGAICLAGCSSNFHALWYRLCAYITNRAIGSDDLHRSIHLIKCFYVRRSCALINVQWKVFGSYS